MSTSAGHLSQTLLDFCRPFLSTNCRVSSPFLLSFVILCFPRCDLNEREHQSDFGRTIGVLKNGFEVQ